MERNLFAEEHELFRRSFRTFLEREVVPISSAGWRPASSTAGPGARPGGRDSSCPWLEEAHGGPGGDFLHSVVVIEELAAVYDSGFAMSLHSDIVVPYIHAFGTDDPGLSAHTTCTLTGRGA